MPDSVYIHKIFPTFPTCFVSQSHIADNRAHSESRWPATQSPAAAAGSLSVFRCQAGFQHPSFLHVRVWNRSSKDLQILLRP